MAMAKAAGYDVLALDIFADSDTEQLATQVFRLPYADGGFDPAGFEAALATIAARHEVLGFVYGSGFEANPQLLETAAHYFPVVGNSASVVKQAKAVPDFFRTLDALGIPHPPVSMEVPALLAGWLHKQAGGSGGTHIRRLEAGGRKNAGSYYQQELAGIPVSLLFAAHAGDAHVIGYNRQSVAAHGDLPFRYGGLVTNVALPDTCRKILYVAAQHLTRVLKLRGLNSIDAMLTPTGDTYILELNPRLTASAGLYHSIPGLMQLHLGEGASALDIGRQASAQAVVYAEYDAIVPEGLEWPEWAADIPVAGSHIAAGDPLCTVYAQADGAEAAWQLAHQRLQVMTAMQPLSGR
ncbi:Predicted ATP-dependent carboligase, ATP-grasp superfamily [Methylobacillus rhizosphaerae]|uniref:Predicted ATP-dependent carboligase, ATP-grasp superfamily n=1 Tax=Methylobacillus rhizosphaerae TaxID=551994 RepID=A0A238YKK1_9PROT|nr:Predicted ATP-dependent carboligase, ATP-grasp superfamily [Methylobacillus rhizosphaerae]